MPVPSSGEVRFSAIGTEFEDSNPIRLSHYFKNILTVNTNHISSFPNSFNEFRLSLFRGKEKFIEDQGSDLYPPTPQQTNFADLGINLNDGNTINNYRTNTNYEIISGLRAKNITYTLDNDVLFDNRTEEQNNHGFYALSSATQNNYKTFPDLIIQARAGDSLELTARIVAKSGYSEKCKLWFWDHSILKWKHIETKNATLNSPYTYYYAAYRTYYYHYYHDYVFIYKIPDDTPPGNYGIAFACEYSSGYRSWKSYSLHVWE